MENNNTTADCAGVPRLGMVGGMRIIPNDLCTVREQYRFPRSKRRRIINRWAKRESNFRRVPDPDMYSLPYQRVIVGHPATIARLYQASIPASAGKES